MEEHYKNRTLGIVLAIIGAILGIGLNLAFFFTQYEPMIAAQIAMYPMRTNWKIITYILPIFAGMGTLAGTMYAVSSYGFIKKTNDAYKVSMIANVIALLFSFWPMIPAMDTDLFPYWVIIFIPNTLIYLLLNLLVGKKNFGRVALGLITGMTMVMAYINGTASLNIFWMTGNIFYIIANPIHYTVMVSFGIITIGIMLRPKKWLRILVIVVGILEIGIGGYMGITTTITKGEFSMYLGAPALSIVILVVVIWGAAWNKIVKSEER